MVKRLKNMLKKCYKDNGVSGIVEILGYIVFVIIIIYTSISALAKSSGEQWDIIDKNIDVIKWLLTVFMVEQVTQRFGILEAIKKKTEIKPEVSMEYDHVYNDKHPVKELWTDAKQVRIMGENCINLLRGSPYNEIENKIQNNKANFKFIVMNSNSANAETSIEHFIHIKNTREKERETFSDSEGRLKVLKERFGVDKIEYISCNIQMPYSIMHVIKENDIESFVKVTLYSYYDSDIKSSTDRKTFTIRKNENVENYNFFVDQWDILWKKASADARER